MFIGRSRKCRDMRRKRSAYGPSGVGDLDMERTVGKTERKDGECCHMTSGIGLGDNGGMTIATPERYAQMLDAARRGGYAYPASQATQQQPGYGYAQKSKIVAGLLGLFLGTLGVHNFYLGYTGKAVAQLLLTLIGWIILIGPIISGIWALIEAVLILCSSYGSNWHRDGRGQELQD